ncbi:hypothetical protein V3C99_007094 [Haemonchus contortus]
MAVEQTVIEGLLVVFYVYILLVIITSKEKILKNAFYSIFIATGIADVTALISGCTLRLTNEASSKEGVEGIMRCCCILSGISACAHLIGNLFITINRYSALCLPYKYDSIWTRRNLLAAVVVQYTVSFAAFAHLFTAEFVYIYNEDGTIAYIILEESASTTVTVTYCISYATYAILCFGFNSRAFFAWRRLSKTDGWSKHRHHDKGLLLYAAAVFIGSMLMCIQEVAYGIAVATGVVALMQLLLIPFFWLIDLMVSIPPIFLLLLSSDLRQKVIDPFRRTKNIVTATVSHSRSRAVTVVKF